MSVSSSAIKPGALAVEIRPSASTSSQNKGEEAVMSPSLRSPKPPHKQGQDYDLNRVHEELEKLNIATDVINKLELQLDEARAAFREIQSSWSQRLEQLSKKLGSCIEKARPYYQAKLQARQIQEEAQKAALRFERANSMHAVAKQQVALTHESLDRQNPKDIDPACLEVLNHHVQRVNEAEKERIQSEEEHRRISLFVEEASNRLHYLERDLSRHIKKSRTYFEARVEFTRVLEEQKALIQRLEAEIKQKKLDYTTSLNNLEEISEQIHLQRQLGKRESGVGSESPGPPASVTESTPKNQLTVKIMEGETGPAPLSPTAKRALEQLQKSPDARRVSDLLDVVEEDAALELGRRERSKTAPPESGSDSGVEFRGYMTAPDSDLRAYRRPASFGGLHSGVILLAHQLSEYGWFQEEKRIRAFTFPPEDLDVEYKTVPEGVKPFPTPPQTPSSGSVSSGKSKTAPTKTLLSPIASVSPPATPASARSTTETSEDVSSGASARGAAGLDRQDTLAVPDAVSLDSFSDRSSLASFSGTSIDDDRLDQMLKSHRELIEEIEVTAERAKAFSRNGKLDKSVDELPSFDRGSASGESCSG